MTDIHDYSLKFIIIGDSSVGKSNLMLQFTEKKFEPNHDITIGVEFGYKMISKDNNVYKLSIWDTAGQEAFNSLTRLFYRNSVGCLLVYDITNRNTYNTIQKRLDDLKENVEDISIILIGNKNDLVNNRQVPKEEAELFAKDNNILFFETSAKLGTNVNQAYQCLIDNIHEKILSGDLVIKKKDDNVQLDKRNFYSCC
jgi:Ras-related protein Rab-2A